MPVLCQTHMNLTLYFNSSKYQSHFKFKLPHINISISNNSQNLLNHKIRQSHISILNLQLNQVNDRKIYEKNRKRH